MDDIAELRRSVRYWKDAYHRAREDDFEHRHNLKRLQADRDDYATRIRRMEREVRENGNLRAEVQRHREWRREIQQERDSSLVRIKELELEVQKLKTVEAWRQIVAAPQKAPEVKPGETDDVIVTISGLGRSTYATVKFVVSPEDAEAAFQWYKDPSVPPAGSSGPRKLCFSLRYGEGHEVGQALPDGLNGLKASVNREIIPGYFSHWTTHKVPLPLDLSMLIAPGENALRVSGSGLGRPNKTLYLRKEEPSTAAEGYIRKSTVTFPMPPWACRE